MAHRSECLTGCSLELSHRIRAVITKLVLLEVAEDILGRIKFGGVSRQTIADDLSFEI